MASIDASFTIETGGRKCHVMWILSSQRKIVHFFPMYVHRTLHLRRQISQPTTPHGISKDKWVHDYTQTCTVEYVGSAQLDPIFP